MSKVTKTPDWFYDAYKDACYATRGWAAYKCISLSDYCTLQTKVEELVTKAEEHETDNLYLKARVKELEKTNKKLCVIIDSNGGVYE